MKRVRLAITVSTLMLLFGLMPGIALGDTPAVATPVVLSTDYPAVIATVGSPLTFSVNLTNKTQAWQVLDLKVNGPADWKPTFQSGGFTLRQVTVDPNSSRSVDLQVTPPADAKTQDYVFNVQAVNQDGTAMNNVSVTVTLQPRSSQGGLTLTTSYPDLSGQADSSFSFTFSITNNSSQDRTINFATTVPPNWQATLKPSYESTQVSAISLKSGSNQSMELDVTPPHSTPAGRYPVTVRATAGGDTAQIPLSVVVIGNPALSLTTSSGQLNTHPTVDATTSLPLIIKNSGSAPLQNVSLSASTPSGWNVTLTPSTIDSLPVGQTAQVNASIQPGTRALAGDYMVTLTASSGSASDSKDIRVTVETPTTWGWVAVGAIAVVVVGLGLVFARYSRR